MTKLKIKEAIAVARINGKKVNSCMLARQLYPEDSKRNMYQKTRDLINGKRKRIEIDAVGIICRETGVSADYLFGLTDKPNNNNNQ